MDMAVHDRVPGATAHRARSKRIRVLWVSQHWPAKGQFKAMRREFGSNFKFTPHDKRFSSAGEVVQRFILGGFDEMVFVGPDTVLRHLVDAMQKYGRNVYQAVMTSDGSYGLEVVEAIHKISRPV